jgi:hypothetical protein
VATAFASMTLGKRFEESPQMQALTACCGLCAAGHPGLPIAMAHDKAHVCTCSKEKRGKKTFEGSSAAGDQTPRTC